MTYTELSVEKRVDSLKASILQFEEQLYDYEKERDVQSAVLGVETLPEETRTQASALVDRCNIEIAVREAALEELRGKLQDLGLEKGANIRSLRRKKNK